MATTLMVGRAAADTVVMANVSRPLIALLVGTVAFFALWMVALKPSPSTTGGGPSGLGAYQGPVNAAHSVQGTVNKAATADGGSAATTVAPATKATASASATPSGTTTPAASATPAAAATASSAAAATSTSTATAKHSVTSSSVPTASAKVRLTAVQRALAAHKVIALLFYNPASADDAAVKQELKTIPTHRGAVVKLSVPLSELSHYMAISKQVQVEYSPTLVLIDRHAAATTIVGFADTFEIAQRLDETLAQH
jgi:hypothetical protein